MSNHILKQLLLFHDWRIPAIGNAVPRTLTRLKPGLSEHRQRILKYENMHLLEGIPREGILGMPKANPIHLTSFPTIYAPYNCRKSFNSNYIGIHFFIHDYLFKHVWSNLEYTLTQLSKYDLVFSTDDSVYLDRPLIDNLRNIYKNRVFTAVGQRMGMTIVPTFSCGNPDEIEFYCDGLPDGGCIAVGGMGTNRSHSQRAIVRYCVQEMVKRKHPDMLFTYGITYDLGLDIPIVRIPPFIEKFNH